MENSTKSEQIQNALEHINDLSRRRNWLQTLILEKRNDLNTIRLRVRNGNFKVSAISLSNGDSSFGIQFNSHVKGMDVSLVQDIVSGMIKEMETELDEIDKEIEKYLKF